MDLSGASQHCQICWRGQRAHWEVWDVNALLDLAIISAKVWAARRLGFLAGLCWVRRCWGHAGKLLGRAGLPDSVLRGCHNLVSGK